MIFLLLALLADAQASQKSSPSAGFASLSRQAEVARDNHRLDDALKLYRQALQLNPRWAEGWFYLGTIFYDRDQFLEASAAFVKSTQYAPENSVPWAFLGLSEYGTGDYAKALQHLLKAKGMGIGLGDRVGESVRFRLATLLTKFEQYEAAMDLFGEYAKRGDDTARVLEATGIAALRMPLLPSELPIEKKPLALQVGRAMFETGMRKEASALAMFEQIVQQYPDVPNIHYLYGTFLLRVPGDRGIEQLKKEIEISPKHVPARLQIAFEYIKRSDFATGLPFAREATEIAPDSFVAWNALGRLQTGLGQHEEAVKSLEKAVELAPESPETRFALATAYARVGRNEDAARERAKFLKLKSPVKKTEEP